MNRSDCATETQHSSDAPHGTATGQDPPRGTGVRQGTGGAALPRAAWPVVPRFRTAPPPANPAMHRREPQSCSRVLADSSRPTCSRRHRADPHKIFITRSSPSTGGLSSPLVAHSLSSLLQVHPVIPLRGTVQHRIWVSHRLWSVIRSAGIAHAVTAYITVLRFVARPEATSDKPGPTRSGVVCSGPAQLGAAPRYYACSGGLL